MSTRVVGGGRKPFRPKLAESENRIISVEFRHRHPEVGWGVPRDRQDPGDLSGLCIRGLCCGIDGYICQVVRLCKSIEVCAGLGVGRGKEERSEV
jgi:hypothetical protein